MKRGLVAWAPVVLLGGLAAGVASLLNRVLRPAREARLYVDDAHEATETIIENLRAIEGLERTPHAARRLADATAAHAGEGT